MLKAYRVSFQYSERTYCTNIATAANLQDTDNENIEDFCPGAVEAFRKDSENNPEY